MHHRSIARLLAVAARAAGIVALAAPLTGQGASPRTS